MVGYHPGGWILSEISRRFKWIFLNIGKHFLGAKFLKMLYFLSIFELFVIPVLYFWRIRFARFENFECPKTEH
jgi:hypothetical protein